MELQSRHENVSIDVSRGPDTSMVICDHNIELMNHVPRSNDQDSKTAVTLPAPGHEIIHSQTPGAEPVAVDPVIGIRERLKAKIVYTSIVAGILICLVWSAALFWLLIKVASYLIG